MFKRPSVSKEEIKEIECRHVVYCYPRGEGDADLHLIKEVIHTHDGRTIPHLRMVKNFKRDFYITKPGFRNHKQKKEWEDLDRLQRFQTRECDLERRIIQALDLYSPSRSRRMLFRSPYIYGADITSTALIKKRYMDQFKGSPTPASVAAFDIETDVLHDTGEMLMATISMKDKVYTAVVAKFVEGIADVKRRLHEIAGKNLGEFFKARGIQWEVEIVDTPAKAVLESFKRAHQWMPDYVAIWNIDFDLPKIVEALEKEGYSPAQVFSDPNLPSGYKHFSYRKGPTQRKTASGGFMALKPSQQWHTVVTPASFQFIDAMQAYYQIRTGSAEKRSYGLDAIAGEHLGIKKLRFEEDAHIAEGTLEWHEFMQANCKLNYVVYNVFDTVLMELLDEKTQDLAFMVSIFGGASDLQIFNSQPRRKCVELHFELLEEHNKVIATTSDQMRDEIDDETYDLTGWIVTLPANLIADNGLKIIEEHPDLPSSARIAVADLDVKSAYPNNGAALNISKSTTVGEVIAVEGVEEFHARMQGLGLSGGATNAIEFSTTMFGLPKLDEWVEIFDQEQNNTLEAS